ncbi:MAG: precorrin-6y C5,15-methyltransferase (decarboxylating) subunit CbiE, partial [bacterium]
MSNSYPELTVIGVEPTGIYDPAGRDALQKADVVMGWNRHLETVSLESNCEFVEITELQECVPTFESYDPDHHVVLLATGDPLFFGIGSYLKKRIPASHLEYIPARSSVQLAFASLKTTYNDALVHSLHGRKLDTLRTALTKSPPALAL